MLSKKYKLKHALNRNMIHSFQGNLKTDPVVMCLSILVSCYFIYISNMFIISTLLHGVRTISCAGKNISYIHISNLTFHIMSFFIPI